MACFAVLGVCGRQKLLMPYPVAEADLQPMKLQFASKWIGLIASWCNRKHLRPYLNICKKLHSFDFNIPSYTEEKKTKQTNQNLRRGEYSESFSMLCCVFIVASGKRPELLPQRQLKFWPLNKFLCFSVVSRWKQLNIRDGDKWGQELGTPGLGPFCFPVPLAALVPSPSASLENLASHDRWLQ